ncbi:MAG: hypothetical protein JRN20_15500 [Nitrososphaerota archaeon]|nr:hypothetical protein [Nitrososphaerota archaeon]
MVVDAEEEIVDRQRQQQPYVYELRSINLSSLPSAEAASLLDFFALFLNSLSEPITFSIVEDERKVYAGDTTWSIAYKRYFLSSQVEISSLLTQLVGGEERVVRVGSVPRLEILHDSGTFLVDSQSSFVSVYNVTRLSGKMSAGFLSSIYSIAQETKIEIVPIEMYRAKKLAKGRLRSVAARMIERQGRLEDPELEAEFSRSRNVASEIAASNQRLFKLRMNIVIRARTDRELQEKRKLLHQICGGIVEEIDSPMWVQLPLYTGVGPKWATGRFFVMPTESVVVFFPVAGLDVTDPSGTFLGRNLQTGNAILYDVFEKENYNVAIMGESGFGKSTFIKSFFSRMALQYPELSMFVFDSIAKTEYALGPDGKYESSFAGLTGCHVHRYLVDDKSRGAGLDPFSIFPDKNRAAEFVASLAKIEEGTEMWDDLSNTSRGCSNVEDLISGSPPSLKKRLEAVVQPFGFLFRKAGGEEKQMPFYERMVFVLNDIQSKKLRDAAAFLTFSAVWERIIKKELPVKRKKVIIIDEGWALVEKDPSTGKSYFPMAVEYVPEIARTARHYNCSFAIATQLVTDFFGRAGEYGPGRPMVESCATKIILKQDDAASKAIREALLISPQDERFILNAKIGEGLLVTHEGHLRFYNQLGHSEETIFSTSPKEQQ